MAVFQTNHGSVNTLVDAMHYKSSSDSALLNITYNKPINYDTPLGTDVIHHGSMPCSPEKLEFNLDKGSGYPVSYAFPPSHQKIHLHQGLHRFGLHSPPREIHFDAIQSS